MIAEVSGPRTYMTLEECAVTAFSTTALPFLFTIAPPAILKFQFALSAI
jgi:hypothetical protein